MARRVVGGLVDVTRKSFGGNVYFCISLDPVDFGGMREFVTRCAANYS